MGEYGYVTFLVVFFFCFVGWGHCEDVAFDALDVGTSNDLE